MAARVRRCDFDGCDALFRVGQPFCIQCGAWKCNDCGFCLGTTPHQLCGRGGMWCDFGEEEEEAQEEEEEGYGPAVPFTGGGDPVKPASRFPA